MDYTIIVKMFSSQKRKATFVLEARILAELKEAAKATGAKSVNALVRTAISRFLEEAKRTRKKELYRQAAADPLFLSDVHEIERDFLHADSELLKDR